MKPFQEKRRTQEKDFKFLPVTYCTQRKRAQIVSYFTAFPGIICLTVQVKVLDSYNSCVQAVHYMDDFNGCPLQTMHDLPVSLIKRGVYGRANAPALNRATEQ